MPVNTRIFATATKNEIAMKEVHASTWGKILMIGLIFIQSAACVPSNALESEFQSSNQKSNNATAIYHGRAQEQQRKATDEPNNWRSHFTFEGLSRPGPYLLDPHVWVYTKAFAERFGMPKEWISNELQGVEAAAWRSIKTGYVTCGWGGKRDACKEEDEAILELYFDTGKVKLPWAPWSRESDMLAYTQWGNSQRFLVPQKCEIRRENSVSPVGDRGVKCEGRISRQPLANPKTGEEIFLFAKAATYTGQGKFYPLAAYDKRTYPDLAWIQINYRRPVGLASSSADVVITLETRTAPLGRTLHKLHEILLPADFDHRIKMLLDAGREAQREFYKKVLDME